jgi:YD repeat-containing protein
VGTVVWPSRYDYDVLDNLASVTDLNGNVTRYAYDDFRRMTQQDSPVTNATTYVYDPAGNLISPL